MSSHWKLAAWYTVWVCLAAVVAGIVIGLRWGTTYAEAFGYGVTIGIVSFTSTAVSVSMLTGGSSVLRALGAASFGARYGFVAVALGLPAYYELWPVVAMLGGFSGVYLSENFVLLPGVARIMSRSRSGRNTVEEPGTDSGEKVQSGGETEREVAA